MEIFLKFKVVFMKKHIIALSLLTSFSSSSVLAAGQNVTEVQFDGLISTATCDFEIKTANGVVNTIDFGVFDDSAPTTADAVFGTEVPFSVVPESSCSGTFTNGAEIKVTSADTVTDNSIVTDGRNASAGVQVKLADGTKVVNAGYTNILSSNTTAYTPSTGAILFKAQPYAHLATLTPGQFGGKISLQVAYK
ncbi:type 1 fimbrial protein [Vibrio parahaemolyticus]|nr:type 1 fimbrial protein [Vibrio parahaemolyticus]